MRALALVLALLLPGCLGGDADAPATPSAPTPTAAASVRSVPDGASTAAEVAALPVGRAWTYEGVEFYNPETEWTVVVARADEDGYLLAGGSEAEIVYAALWGGRWYGEVDRHLMRSATVRELDLPLHDGKTWEMHEGYALTARAAEIATPLGTMPGFIVEGKGEGEASFRGEYVPEIGNFVRLKEVWTSGRIGQDVRMTRVADGAKWVWHELGARVETGTPQSPVQLDVPAGFDQVIVSAGGRDGSRAFVQGPGGAQWTNEFTAEETWVHAMLPATEGKWAATVAGRVFVADAPDLPADPPVGWAYVVIAPVKWTRSG